MTNGEEKEPGTNGGLGLNGEEPPDAGNKIDVKDAKKAVKMIEKAGGRVTSPACRAWRGLECLL